MDALPPALADPAQLTRSRQREQRLAWLCIVELAVLLLLMLGVSALLYILLGVLCCGR